MCLENLNMTKKMSSNPGLTHAVRWKSCSDCKAAWVSVHLQHCLSVTLDKLPDTVRAPVHQDHETTRQSLITDDSWVQVSTHCPAQLQCQPCPSFFVIVVVWKYHVKDCSCLRCTAATPGGRCEGLRSSSSF